MLRICVRRGKSVDISVKPPSRRRGRGVFGSNPPRRSQGGFEPNTPMPSRGKVVLQFTLRHDHCWSFCRVGGCYFPQKMARNGWHVQLWRHRRRIWLIFLKIWRRIWTVEECNEVQYGNIWDSAFKYYFSIRNNIPS